MLPLDNEEKELMLAALLKVMRGEGLSSGDFQRWINFLKINPKIESLNIDQAQALQEEARNVMRGYVNVK